MNVKSILSKIKESEIYKLVLDGDVIGLRVKVYNVELGNFDYYDFTLRTVENNKAIRDFINSNQNSFSSIKLIEYNDVYSSEDEINGTIVVKEFKDEANVVNVLRPMVDIYRYKAGDGVC